jgi:hypothetical protein
MAARLGRFRHAEQSARRTVHSGDILFAPVPMLASLLAMSSRLYAALGLIPLLLLALLAFYALYLIKGRLGIDVFRHGGLHLYGPRTLVRRLVAKLGG